MSDATPERRLMKFWVVAIGSTPEDFRQLDIFTRNREEAEAYANLIPGAYVLEIDNDREITEEEARQIYRDSIEPEGS